MKSVSNIPLYTHSYLVASPKGYTKHYYVPNFSGFEGSEETDIYYFHSDHLGSASWITDAGGIPIQYLQYLPFGEPFVDQRMTNYSERFTFTGKERDEETGYYNFGARYLDPLGLAGWLSVDPLSDKYPSTSPYMYCLGNPIRLVDPNGMEVADYYNMNGTYLGWDGKFDNKVYFVRDGKSENLIRQNNQADPESGRRGTTDVSSINVELGTTYNVLQEAVNVHRRTENNGGGREESSIVTPYGTYRGATGNSQGAELPVIPSEFRSGGNVSVHSHSFDLRNTQPGIDNGSYSDIMSGQDAKVFGNYSQNVIVGNSSELRVRSVSFYKKTNELIKPTHTFSLKTIQRTLQNKPTLYNRLLK